MEQEQLDLEFGLEYIKVLEERFKRGEIINPDEQASLYFYQRDETAITVYVEGEATYNCYCHSIWTDRTGRALLPCGPTTLLNGRGQDPNLTIMKNQGNYTVVDWTKIEQYWKGKIAVSYGPKMYDFSADGPKKLKDNIFEKKIGRRIIVLYGDTELIATRIPGLDGLHWTYSYFVKRLRHAAVMPAPWNEEELSNASFYSKASSATGEIVKHKNLTALTGGGLGYGDIVAVIYIDNDPSDVKKCNCDCNTLRVVTTNLKLKMSNRDIYTICCPDTVPLPSTLNVYFRLIGSCNSTCATSTTFPIFYNSLFDNWVGQDLDWGCGTITGTFQCNEDGSFTLILDACFNHSGPVTITKTIDACADFYRTSATFEDGCTIYAGTCSVPIDGGACECGIKVTPLTLSFP